MTFRKLLALFLFVCSAGTAFSNNYPDGVSPQPELQRFVNYGSSFLEKTHGKPKKEDIKKTQNLHIPEQTDEWHTIHYDGLTITFYRSGSAPKDLLKKVILSGKKFKMPFGLRVGVKKEEIIKKLGKPTEDTANKLVYELLQESDLISVTFRFFKDSLSEVQWDFAFD